MTDKEMQDLFREMRDEAVPVDSLARVRIGVASKVGQSCWRELWKVAAVLAMAGCVVAGFLWLRPVKTPVVVQRPSIPEIAQVIPPSDPIVRSVSRPKRVRRTPRVQAVPVLIRIETPDPDVVILLVN